MKKMPSYKDMVIVEDIPGLFYVGTRKNAEKLRFINSKGYSFKSECLGCFRAKDPTGKEHLFTDRFAFDRFLGREYRKYTQKGDRKDE